MPRTQKYTFTHLYWYIEGQNSKAKLMTKSKHELHNKQWIMPTNWDNRKGIDTFKKRVAHKR